MIKHRIRRFFAGTAAAILCLVLVIHALAWVKPENLSAPARSSAIVFANVGVVDVRQGGLVTPAQWVVVVDDRITSVGPSGSTGVPAGATVIDASGKFLMAGLWDAHIHTLRLSPQLHFPLLIANGVTSVRDMGNTCSWSESSDCVSPIPNWRDQIQGGAMVGPRLVQSASFHLEEFPSEAGALEARIDALKQSGEPFLKVQLPEQTLTADFARVMAMAHRKGFAVAGHLPRAVDVVSAPHAMASIEHDWSLLPQCADGAAAFDGRNRSKAALLASINPRRCEQVLAHLAKSETAYVPTHVASTGQEYRMAQDGPSPVAALTEQFVVAPQRWMWALMRHAGKEPVPVQETLSEVHQAALRLTRQAHAAGVPVLAGTDALDADVLHGFGLHQELEYLVAAGLSPAQTLAAATWLPATAFGMGNQLGSVQTGKLADLLLLNANPLLDIRNTRDIDSVVAGGRLYRSAERAVALSFVAEQVQRWTTISRFVVGLWLSP